MKAKLYNNQGVTVKEISLDSQVFGVKVAIGLLHQVFTSARANARPMVAHTKTRKQVRGGGKKPWRQKGTGRARHGSSRSPIWRAGGVVFGPLSERNYTQKVNKKMRKQALKMVLSAMAKEGKVLLVEPFALTDQPKTAVVAKTLTALPSSGRSTCLVGDSTNGLKVKRAASNIARLTVLPSNALSFLVIVNCEYLITTEQGVSEITAQLTGKEVAKVEKAVVPKKSRATIGAQSKVAAAKATAGAK